jgi:hypothetical protein
MFHMGICAMVGAQPIHTIRERGSRRVLTGDAVEDARKRIALEIDKVAAAITPSA